MKQISVLVSAFFFSLAANAQLYSSGNNLISGNNIGIGTNAPLAIMHLKGVSGSSSEIRLQHTATSGASRFSFFADNGTSLSTTGDYAVMNKYTAGTTGTLVSGFPLRSLYAFSNSKGSLFFTSAANVGFGQWNASTNTYTTRMMIDSATGHIGIGTTSPTARLHIHNSATSNVFKISNNTSGSTVNDGFEIRTNGDAVSIMNLENNVLNLGTNNTTKLTVDALGNVIIGSTTTPTGYKLFVEQGILTEKVKVAVKTSSNWSDYVFADNYTLQPLNSVEKFIKEHKHLPGIPSAKEVVDNGIDVATMDAKLLEKIEELTLHMIQMQKDIEQLKSENAQLKSIANQTDK